MFDINSGNDVDIFSNEKIKHHLRSDIPTNEDLIIKQLSLGFTIIGEEESASTDNENFSIYYFKKRINVVNLDLVSSERKKNFNRNLNLWRSVFTSKGNILYSKDNLILQTKISESITILNDELTRQEIYVPIAFLENGKPISGAFFNLWMAGQISPDMIANYLPISAFYMGSCLFGVTLYGVDEQNKKHPLSNPKYQMPNNSIIVDIMKVHETHPDEILSRKLLINMIPLIKILSHPHQPIIKHQIPTINYILYGINRYLNQEITREALSVYIKIVKKQAEKQKELFKEIATHFDVKIEFYSSLQALKLEELSEESIVESLINLVGIKPLNTTTKTMPTVDSLFMAIVSYLSSIDDQSGLVWKTIREKINFSDSGSLFELNYLDYCATLALVKIESGNGNICSLTPTHERQISVNYKKIFSATFGGIMCMNYLPSLLVGISKYNYGIFYLDRNIESINDLLNEEITSLSGLQTAAIALNSEELLLKTNKEISYLLSNFIEKQNRKEEYSVF